MSDFLHGLDPRFARTIIKKSHCEEPADWSRDNFLFQLILFTDTKSDKKPSGHRFFFSSILYSCGSRSVTQEPFWFAERGVIRCKSKDQNHQCKGENRSPRNQKQLLRRLISVCVGFKIQDKSLFGRWIKSQRTAAAEFQWEVWLLANLKRLRTRDFVRRVYEARRRK